jgi:hypothetical protein
LDRIQDVILLPDVVFEPNKGFDPTVYFSNIVGVTRNIGDKPVEVKFFANHFHAPYIRTKPIHFSQKVLEEKEGGILFSITIILNFELERELMGFGEGLKVLSPNSLVRRIKKKVQLMQDLYRDN